MYGRILNSLMTLLKSQGPRLAPLIKEFVNRMAPYIARLSPAIREKLRAGLATRTGQRGMINDQLKYIIDDSLGKNPNWERIGWVIILVLDAVGDEAIEAAVELWDKMELTDWIPDFLLAHGSDEQILPPAGSSYVTVYDADGNNEFTPDEVSQIYDDFARVISVCGSAAAAHEFLNAIRRLTKDERVLESAGRLVRSGR